MGLPCDIPAYHIDYTTCVSVCICVLFCVYVSCTGKNRRLKQAKEEAQAEIEQYRLQREKEFKTKEAAVSLVKIKVL